VSDIEARYGNVKALFEGKHFHVPVYQRDYAWDTDNVGDLLSDIADVAEAVDASVPHFIGTIILGPQVGEPRSVAVVDGQQRLATLILLGFALRHELTRLQTAPPPPPWLLADGGGPRLTLAGDDDAFFRGLLVDGQCSEPKTGSQRRLRDAYKTIRARVATLDAANLGAWLHALERLEVLQLDVDDGGRAVHMFQTLNDRGKPLSQRPHLRLVEDLGIHDANRLDGVHPQPGASLKVGQPWGGGGAGRGRIDGRSGRVLSAPDAANSSAGWVPSMPPEDLGAGPDHGHGGHGGSAYHRRNTNHIYVPARRRAGSPRP
jgi:hypothetical protein